MDVGRRICGGRRCSARAKSGAGKTVRDLTRMAVVVSGWRRCGLNWYLERGGAQARVRLAETLLKCGCWGEAQRGSKRLGKSRRRRRRRSIR